MARCLNHRIHLQQVWVRGNSWYLYHLISWLSLGRPLRTILANLDLNLHPSNSWTYRYESRGLKWLQLSSPRPWCIRDSQKTLNQCQSQRTTTRLAHSPAFRVSDCSYRYVSYRHIAAAACTLYPQSTIWRNTRHSWTSRSQVSVLNIRYRSSNKRHTDPMSDRMHMSQRLSYLQWV